MTNWIKVWRERRMKLVFVNSCEVEDYLLISKLPDVRLTSTFDMPTDWTVGDVSYDHVSSAFTFIVLSPEFEPVPLGEMPETLVADRHIIEITRKAVSA